VVEASAWPRRPTTVFEANADCEELGGGVVAGLHQRTADPDAVGVLAQVTLSSATRSPRPVSAQYQRKARRFIRLNLNPGTRSSLMPQKAPLCVPPNGPHRALLPDGAATCAGARRLRSLSVTSFPSASVLGRQSSRLPTGHMPRARSCRTYGARPCPRHADPDVHWRFLLRIVMRCLQGHADGEMLNVEMQCKAHPDAHAFPPNCTSPSARAPGGAQNSIFCLLVTIWVNAR
jgi:hypothetical protein